MKRKLSAFLALALSVTALTACNSGSNGGVTELGESKYGDTYPIDTDKTLTWYIPLESNAAQSVKNLGDTAFAKELERQLGVDIEFIHPATGGSESFNLMLASDELPDIISHYWTDFPGGPDKAIADGYIINLADYVDAYAPNLKKLLNDNPEYAKDIKTDTGNVYQVPYITTAVSTGGIIIRQDWLDDLGLQMPNTLDEWENVLTQFKDKKGAKAPFSAEMVNVFRCGAFSGAYGLQLGWYLDDGKVNYGYYADGYKDFLTKMNDWYEKGLIDRNFSTSDSKTFTANMLNGTSGVTYGGITSGINKFNSAKAETDPKYKAVAAPFPTAKKGETPEFGQKSSAVTVFGCAISTSCDDPELAMRVLDFAYSEAGQMIFNYGVEGESYEMVDGKPVFTDKILKPEEGKTTGQVLSYYAKPYNSYNSIQIMDAYTQTLTTPEMVNALTVWADCNQDKHSLPKLFATAEEQAELATLENSVSTYAQEMLFKFVMGAESLDNYDKYIKNLEDMGIKRLIELKQAAYERAQNRK